MNFGGILEKLTLHVRSLEVRKVGGTTNRDRSIFPYSRTKVRETVDKVFVYCLQSSSYFQE